MSLADTPELAGSRSVTALCAQNAQYHVICQLLRKVITVLLQPMSVLHEAMKAIEQFVTELAVEDTSARM